MFLHVCCALQFSVCVCVCMCLCTVCVCVCVFVHSVCVCTIVFNFSLSFIISSTLGFNRSNVWSFSNTPGYQSKLNLHVYMCSKHHTQLREGKIKPCLHARAELNVHL